MMFRKALFVFLPIAGVLFSVSSKPAFAGEATLSFSGRVLPACELAAPDQAALYNPGNAPEVMVLRCNHGAEFQVVSIDDGRGKSGRNNEVAADEFVQDGTAGNRLAMRWQSNGSKLDEEEPTETAMMFTVVP
jgi:hypothetical protein